jgi:predicted permease
VHGSVSCRPTALRTVGDVIDTVVKLLPALLGIAIGFVLRRRGVADQHDAVFMFRFIINVFLPALAFTALSRRRSIETWRSSR